MTKHYQTVSKGYLGTSRRRPELGLCRSSSTEERADHSVRPDGKSTTRSLDSDNNGSEPGLS